MAMSSGNTKWRQQVFGLLLISCLTFPVMTAAQDDNWAPGQPVGSMLPEFTLPDSTGTPREISSLRGSQGMLLLFNRSTDW